MKRLAYATLLAAACGGGGSTPTTPTPPVSRPTTAAPNGTLLTDRTALYPRVIRLAHNGDANGRLLLTYVTFDGSAYGQGQVVQSADDGRTWSAPIGAVRDTSAHGLCCGTLYEVPRATGGLAEGTLLWAASVGQDETNRRMAIRVWKSTDRGVNWSYLSSCAVSPNAGGVWEPEFSVAADGRLVCHYSDESQQPQHSQTLMRAYSSDGGATWGTPVPTVASIFTGYRPGMATVRQLPSGKYVMTYEMCGLPGAANCAAHLRTSADGLDWGDPTSIGTRILARDGRYFAHTPVLALAPGGGADGRLLLVGQLVFTSAGAQDASAGQLLMTNANGGDGPWDTAAAPFAVPNVYDNYCPNYSASPLASADGARVLLVATAYEGTTCKAYFGTGALAP